MAMALEVLTKKDFMCVLLRMLRELAKGSFVEDFGAREVVVSSSAPETQTRVGLPAIAWQVFKPKKWNSLRASQSASGGQSAAARLRKSCRAEISFVSLAR